MNNETPRSDTKERMMETNHDIVPTLRMFDGLMMHKAADEIEALRKLVDELRDNLTTPNPSWPPLGEGPRKKIIITVEVPEDWEERLDMQWVLEREIHADRWAWSWPETPNA